MDRSTFLHSKAVSRMTRLSQHLRPIYSASAAGSAPSPASVDDIVVDKTLEYGAELDANHPGFTDVEYRKRRAMIVNIANTHKYGRPIPRVKYTAQENATWRTAFDKLTQLYPTHACEDFNAAFADLSYPRNEIPQLEDVSNYLKSKTGWTLRPVGGLLSPRDFLNGLAFKVFHSTQYIRHYSQPLYTPEPDIIHEVMGHVPMLSNPAFAALSEELGKCSIGVSDEDISKLSTVYWFSIEFGVLREKNGLLKAYGAGLLSSFGELMNSLSGRPEYRPFDPPVTCMQEYPITRYQPILYVADSFEDATSRLRKFGASLNHAASSERLRL